MGIQPTSMQPKIDSRPFKCLKSTKDLFHWPVGGLIMVFHATGKEHSNLFQLSPATHATMARATCWGYLINESSWTSRGVRTQGAGHLLVYTTKRFSHNTTEWSISNSYAVMVITRLNLYVTNIFIEVYLTFAANKKACRHYHTWHTSREHQPTPPSTQFDSASSRLTSPISQLFH